MGLFKSKGSGSVSGKIQDHGNGVQTNVYRRSDGKEFVDVTVNGQFVGSAPGNNRDGAIKLFTE